MKYLVILLIVIFLVLSSLLLREPDKAQASWYGTGGTWSYRKVFIIDPSKVPSTQSNFPVLIDITDSNLASGAQTDGDDILFTSADGATKLDHEVELYDSSVGRLVAWVEVPTLSSTGDTIIYMYYGNSGASSQQNATGVWDANYVLVQHLETNGGSVVYTDSTNINTCIASGTPTAIAGKIDGAMDIPGTAGVGSDCGSAASIDNLSTFTVEAWINRASLPAAGLQTIASKGATGAGSSWGFQIRPNNGAGTQNRLSLRALWSGATAVWDSTTQITDTTAMYHVVVTYNKGSTANDPLMYINGISETVANTVAPSGTSPNDSSGNFTVGYYASDSGGPLDGIIDELRYSNIIRSADWIQTEYNNQFSTSTFYSISGEQASEPTQAKVKGGGSSTNSKLKVRGGVKFR